MGTLEWDKWDEECSVIGDKGEIGFIDYQDDKSVCNYNPIEEGPIVISVPFPFTDGKPQSVVAGETAADSITIRNTTDEAVDLWIKIYASTPDESFTLSVMKPPVANDDESKGAFMEFFTLEDRMLQPEETLTVWLSCKPKEIGLYTSVVHFDVGSDRIERVVFLLAEDKISQSLASKKPYSRNRKKKQFNVDEFVEGSRPRRAAPRDYKVRFPRYDIPQEIRELILSKQIPDAIITGLSMENYAAFFKALLIMEEIQLEEDMRTYDMNHVSMKRRGNFLSLVVPGLAERRPSLVHRDFVFVKPADADETAPVHQGYVHRVEADEAYLKFSPDFHLRHVEANLYDVRFTYNRINMRRLYQAVDATQDLEAEILFPLMSAHKRNIETNSLVPISCKLNPEQISAIEMILGCKGGSPYVVFGPPGTGKTMTIVEAIVQLYKHQRNSRILVCAPSNSAADYILEKLLNEKGVSIRENDIFRLNATTRPYGDVNPDHICFCFFDEQIFKCPPLFALSRKKIIISTYSSASLLYAEGVQRGCFSHIFLDEAGQASEPDSMIPIANFCWRDTVVVLAGDPMQLGPVIHSRDAENHGLGKSYLERLCESNFYSEEDPNYVTKLVRNYRCHPNILELPSNLFYNGELMACKESTADTDMLLSSSKLLPGCNFPVLFFGIQGFDEREANNPSWFNRIEVSKVINVVNRLITAGNLREEDIGIITPYRQQVLKIKKVLNDDMDLVNIKVGSVEQFQGQEKEVVIVSTVRSTIKHNEFDRAHCLGFLSNPRRFNVAITRAISLLIIIGNPHIISKDQQWNKLLWLCDDHNSYQGCALPDREVCFQESQPFQDDNTDEQPTNDGDWNQDNNNVGDWNQDFTPPDIPKPNTDEAEWSDGWK